MIRETVFTLDQGISRNSGIARPRHRPKAAMCNGRYFSLEVIQTIDTVAIASGHNHPGNRAMSRSRMTRHAKTPPRKQGANLRMPKRSPKCGWISAKGTEAIQMAARSLIGRLRRIRKRIGNKTYICISRGNDQRGVRMGGKTGWSV